MSHPLFEKHRDMLENAVEATRTREYWSPFPEVPSGKIYGESAREDGQAAYDNRLNKHFELDLPGTVGEVGGEISPYGVDLGITYPRVDLDQFLPAVQKAHDQWRRTDIETRIGVCMEILHRLNKRSFELSFAVMHTTGQGWMMSFQAGGPHAQDRGLEAVAYAYQSMTSVPGQATWTKRVGRDETVTLNKTFRIVPRGIAVTVGCSTFPTWNGYPGIFASLATGNALIVKPHPLAILPMAITVETAREVLAEQGLDPNIVTLVADTVAEPVTKDLVTRPEIKIVDYTGSSEFGEWIEANAKQAVVFTEKAGVNSAIIDSVDNLKATTGNLAFTLCLYSGQMCTATQNIFVPKSGIETTEGHKSFDDIAAGVVKAVDWLLSDPKRATEVLGAIQNEKTAARIEEAKQAGGEVLRESTVVENEAFPSARVRSPLIMKVDAKDEDAYMRERFGPIAYIVATESTDQSIELAAKAARERGAITCAIYSTDPAVLEKAEDATAEAGVPLSCNLTGSIWVNQAAAFSDFHVSGANPAGNATLCDTAYVANRYRVVQSRIPVPTPEPVGA